MNGKRNVSDHREYLIHSYDIFFINNSKWGVTSNPSRGESS